jgi:hypothetical protein
MDQLFNGHLSYCSMCGSDISFDPNLLQFSGEYSGNVCSSCRTDFERANGETIETRLAREKCFPGDVIRWRGGGRKQ